MFVVGGDRGQRDVGAGQRGVEDDEGDAGVLLQHQRRPVLDAVLRREADRIRLAADDLAAVGRIDELRVEAAETTTVSVSAIRLAETPQA